MKKILKKELKTFNKNLFKKIKKLANKKLIKILTKVVKTGKLRDKKFEIKNFCKSIEEKECYKLDEFIKKYKKTNTKSNSYKESIKERRKEGYTSCGPYIAYK